MIGGAGEYRDTESRELGGVVVGVVGLAFVAEGEEGDELDPAFGQAFGGGDHVALVAAFFEVGDEDHDGVAGAGDLIFAVAEGFVDVGAAAELGAEEEIDGVIEFFSEIDDGSVEDDEAGADGGHGGHDGSEDGGVNDGGCHGAALVDTKYDVLER